MSSYPGVGTVVPRSWYLSVLRRRNANMREPEPASERDFFYLCRNWCTNFSWEFFSGTTGIRTHDTLPGTAPIALPQRQTR
jgi:hypothetical protein